MSWSYSGNPSVSDKDAVRFLSGRTDDCDQLVSDEEILFAISEEGSGNTYLAAALICDHLSALFSSHTSERVGDINVDGSKLSDQYRKRAEELRRKATSSNGAEMFVGGLSISGNEELDENTDSVQPKFRVGSDYHPGIKENRSEDDDDPSRCY